MEDALKTVVKTMDAGFREVNAAERDSGPQPPADWAMAYVEVTVRSERGGVSQPCVVVTTEASGSTRQEAVAEAIRKAAGEFLPAVKPDPYIDMEQGTREYDWIEALRTSNGLNAVTGLPTHPMGGRVQ